MVAPAPRRPSPSTGPGHVRIIGGRWRGTRLPVVATESLRPSSDRLRETLFNWLQPVLPGARVLDVFAGTGALGIEAVSRGAAHALLIERDAAAARAITATIEKLHAPDRLQLLHGDAIGWLRAHPAASYDIAFLDPPFAGDLLHTALPLLTPLLTPGALFYIEAPIDATQQLPAGWELHREGRSREVRHALYRRGP